jgi:protein involved in polysaccharide export with SLBB domain
MKTKSNRLVEKSSRPLLAEAPAVKANFFSHPVVDLAASIEVYMKNRSSLAHTLLVSTVLSALMSIVLPITSTGQAVTSSFGPRRTTAALDAESRAEQEADQLVALSADKIITLLDQEPGLLLQVKKMLVRKAYAQGRLLAPEDLADNAVFKLIGRDENIRVLITREIEDRQYVRAKPTREELARERQQITSLALPAGAVSEKPAEGKSQEEKYWLQHEHDLQNSLQPSPNPSPNSAPQPAPAQPPPLAPNDPRALLQTQLQYPTEDYGYGTDSNSMLLSTSGMQSITPDLMSGLMTARMAGGSGGTQSGQSGDEDSSRTGLNMSSLGGMSGGMSAGGMTSPFLDSSLSGNSSLSGGSFPSSAQSGAQQLPQQASLRMPRRPLPPTAADLGLDRPMLTRSPNPYADVPSLYDLYSQYSRRSPVLTRFGTEIFKSDTGTLNGLPMDLPMGPDFVLGPGDSLTVNLWGGISQRLLRVVDREGHVVLPEVGSIEVAGHTLGDVQQMVQKSLRTQFRDVDVDVSISRLHSIRVYVVGDVERAGAYDVSALSTPLNALFEAGGPTSRGSLRLLKHYRGALLLEQVDVYDLLLHGVRSGVQRLQTGDTIMVPPMGPAVTVAGMVRRPAIYELNGEKSLAQLLELAGGVLPSGTLRHVDVERLQAHESRSMLALDVPENNNEAAVTKALEDFTIQDGDKIKISPIVSFADKSVFLDGHVFRPGKYAYTDGMKLTDLIKSYKDLLPEPYKAHAEIIRLNAPDYTPEVLAFNLDDALAGKDQDLVLKPFDTVRVFGRFDFEDPPVITVTGAVRDPGDHVTNGATYLRDAIFLAGNATPDAELDDVQIFRKTDDGKLKVLSVSLSKAIAGDAAENVLLEPKDRIFVHKNLARTDPAAVAIEGEVERPGKYPLGANMGAADLVRLAGGMKRGAYTREADLTRYELEGDSKIISDHITVPIAKALANEPDTDARLRDGDVLTIRQLTGWKDVGATINIDGEVIHPGTYGIQAGERLSSILQRAGGFSSNAYPYGARVQVQQLQEETRADLIRRVKGEQAEVQLTPSGDQEDNKQAIILQYQATLEKLQHNAPVGRLVVHISSDVKSWANTPKDIQVRAGDSIYVPKKPGIVIVDGSVYNPTAITFKPGQDAGWYLERAGGPTELANKKAVFVVRADGSVVGGPGGMFGGGVKSAQLQPGDMVVVPEKTFSVSHKFQNTVQVAQIMTAVALAVQVGRSF